MIYFEPSALWHVAKTKTDTSALVCLFLPPQHFLSWCKVEKTVGSGLENLQLPVSEVHRLFFSFFLLHPTVGLHPSSFSYRSGSTRLGGCGAQLLTACYLAAASPRQNWNRRALTHAENQGVVNTNQRQAHSCSRALYSHLLSFPPFFFSMSRQMMPAVEKSSKWQKSWCQECLQTAKLPPPLPLTRAWTHTHTPTQAQEEALLMLKKNPSALPRPV